MRRLEAMTKKVTVKDVFTGRRGFLTDTEYNREMEAWRAARRGLLLTAVN